MIGALSIVTLGALFASSAAAQRDPGGVEPHVQTAFDAAWKRLPPTWRSQLKDVRLDRVVSLGAPAKAPMSVQLLDRAALAFFTNVKRRICVTDAGARLRPTWGRTAPTREQMAAFLLDEVGYEADGDRDQQLEDAWRRFVVTVFAWRGEPAPTPLPEVGAVEVIDRFLIDGVRRSLGGDVPLEQLLFHELAHAVQNHLRRMEPHMIMWGSMSGWRERDGDKPADGYSGGMFAIEQPVVLIRLLLGLPRGASTYVPHPRARFVNTYARYDLREDFAECARLMAYEPQTLAEQAPAKFLYLSALGWSGTLDRRQPGPMWLGRDTMEVDVFRRATVAGARALLSEDAAAVQPHPLAVAATLRAHRVLLKKAELPKAHPNRQAPSDLPPDLLRDFGGDRFTFVVEGEARQLPRERLVAVYDAELCRWVEEHEMVVEFEEMLGDDREELLARYEKDVVGAPDDFERQYRFDRMVPLLRRAATKAELDDLLAKECKHFADPRPLLDRPWPKAKGRSELTAMRYSLLRSGKAVPADVLANPSVEFGTVELLRVHAQQLLARDERDQALAVIAKIPGQTWGAYRRVELQLRAAAAQPAIATADAAPMPRLRNLLLAKVATWLKANGDVDESNRVLGLRRDP